MVVLSRGNLTRTQNFSTPHSLSAEKLCIEVFTPAKIIAIYFYLANNSAKFNKIWYKNSSNRCAIACKDSALYVSLLQRKFLEAGKTSDFLNCDTVDFLSLVNFSHQELFPDQLDWIAGMELRSKLPMQWQIELD